MKKLTAYLKKEPVFCAACILAAISMCLVPPDSSYFSYVDYRVLALLFCLMTIMEGFKRTGLFGKLARGLLGRAKTFRQLELVLVMLCFFCSMWITNDVSLITFVPFTILVLELGGLEREMIPVVVLQTIAANLGSMMTPVGNPQNLYLYSVSGMGMVEFLKIMGPLSALSFAMILGACLLHPDYKLEMDAFKNGLTDKPEDERKNPSVFRENILLAMVFFCSLLSVLRVLPWQILLAVTLLTCVFLHLCWKERFLPAGVDYNLLFTFGAFFIFIGNMKRLDAVGTVISQVLQGRVLLVSFFCSQVISNVPAAILLSGFTDDYGALLQGVNIGGLGTLIASLASLISYKFFAGKSADCPAAGSRGRYLLYFTILNAGMAAVLLLICRLS